MSGRMLGWNEFGEGQWLVQVFECQYKHGCSLLNCICKDLLEPNLDHSLHASQKSESDMFLLCTTHLDFWLHTAGPLDFGSNHTGAARHSIQVLEDRQIAPYKQVFCKELSILQSK